MKKIRTVASLTTAVVLTLAASALVACSKDASQVQTPVNDEIEAVKARNTELETAVKTLSTQIRTLNEEQVQMKKIVSDVTDSVTDQTGSLEKVHEKVDTAAREAADAQDAVGKLRAKVTASSRRSAAASAAAAPPSQRAPSSTARASTPKAFSAKVSPAKGSAAKTGSTKTAAKSLTKANVAAKPLLRSIQRAGTRTPAKRTVPPVRR